MWVILARLLAFVLLLASSGGWLPLAWWFELFVHFLPLYTLALGLLWLPLALHSRDRWALGAGSLALLWNLLCLIPLYLTPRSAAPPAGRLLLSNVLTSNPVPDRLLAYLSCRQADVVVLLEVSPDWIGRLEPVLTQYPGQLLLPRQDNFGLALLSRQPLKNVEQREFWAAADTRVAGRDLRILAAHPPPPISGWAWQLRNQVIDEVAQQLSGDFALLGDFNDTPWAPTMGPLRRRARLARHGLLPSWPTMLPEPVRIPIDQIWLGERIVPFASRLGPPVGSDHLPLEVEI